MIVSAIANGGTLMKPYMIDHVENVGGQTVKKFLPSAYGTLMSANDAQISNTSHEPGGRDWYGFRDAGGILYGGRKTGSAEFETGKETHSWFVGFAPADKPKVAICVLAKSPVPAVRSLRRSQDRCWIGILRNMGSRTKEKGRKAI